MKKTCSELIFCRGGTFAKGATSCCNEVVFLHLQIDIGVRKNILLFLPIYLGDCTHYKMGDVITGSYSVYNAHLLNYAVECTFGGSQSGTNNTSGTFSFPTANANTPCGKVSLIAYERTIYDSQWTNNYSYTEQIICLQPK